MNDRENRTRSFRIEKFIAMPSGSDRTSFCFTITHDHSSDEVWIIHDGTKGRAKAVAEFATF